MSKTNFHSILRGKTYLNEENLKKYFSKNIFNGLANQAYLGKYNSNTRSP